MLVIFAVIASLVASAAATLPPETIEGTLRGVSVGTDNFQRFTAFHGYQAVSYEVTTQDGYILTVYNLPGDRSRVVLLCHGIFDTADGWIIRGNSSLGLMLANAGYDVWYMNFRGNRYSRKHVTLDPNNKQFWDYSSHEMGLYDLPAVVDFVLETTEQKRLSIVGFSQGTTCTFVTGSMRPEYNDKIKAFVGLAPIAYLHNSVGLLQLLIRLGPLLNALLWFLHEVSGYYSVSKAIINLLCTQLNIGYDLCFGGVVSPLIGPDLAAIDREFFDEIVAHFPAGTSKKNLIHYSQIGISERFGAYDYGAEKNMQVYNASTPPTYDLSKVDMDAYLVSGPNDFVSTIADGALLARQLPRLKEWRVVDDLLYNHLDLIWAKDVHIKVNAYVLRVMAKYNPI